MSEERSGGMVAGAPAPRHLEDAVAPPDGGVTVQRRPPAAARVAARVAAWVLPALLLGLLCAWPLSRGAFGLQIGSVVAIFALAVIGIDLIVGRAGMLQFGYALFFGAGAYTVGLLSQHTGLPSGAGVLAGAAVAALIALVVGPLIVGVGGYLFGLVTLSSVVALESFVRGSDALGGSRGLAGISRDLVGVGPVSSRTLYLLLVMITLAAMLLYARLPRSRTGRALEALRVAPHVAEASGVRLRGLRLRVWVASALVAGFAGGLFAVTVQFVSPEVVGPSTSISFLVMNIMGGTGVAWAGIPGAVVVRGLVQAVQQLQDYQLLISGLATVAVVVWFRRGVAGTLEDAWRRLAAYGRARGATAGAGVAQDASEAGAARLDLEAVDAPLLRVEGLSVRFGGVQALADLSLSVPPGEVTALVGPNGSGKTTFVNTVSGRVRPETGRIVLGERDITRSGVAQRAALGVTRTFQLVSLCDRLSVLENVMLGGHLLGRAGLLRACVPYAHDAEERAIRERALRVAAALGIEDLLGQRAADLAAGPRRLAEICRCLMTRADIVLLDEPASGLNTAERARLQAVVRQLADSGRGVLLIEHDMRFVMEAADRVVVLNRGTKLAEGEPAEVRADPAVIEAYMGEGDD